MIVASEVSDVSHLKDNSAHFLYILNVELFVLLFSTSTVVAVEL